MCKLTLQVMLVRSAVTASPSTYMRRLGAFSEPSDIHSSSALESYKANLDNFDSVHAMCEDYRASAPGAVDLRRDAEDIAAGRKVRMPLKVLWGAKGIIEKCFDAMAEWSAVCELAVEGRSVPTGHYIPEGVYTLIQYVVGLVLWLLTCPSPHRNGPHCVGCRDRGISGGS